MFYLFIYFSFSQSLRLDTDMTNDSSAGLKSGICRKFSICGIWINVICNVTGYFNFDIKWSLLTAVSFPLCSLPVIVRPVRTLENAFRCTRKMDISVSAWKDSPEKTAKRVRNTELKQCCL